MFIIITNRFFLFVPFKSSDILCLFLCLLHALRTFQGCFFDNFSKSTDSLNRMPNAFCDIKTEGRSNVRKNKLKKTTAWIHIQVYSSSAPLFSHAVFFCSNCCFILVLCLVYRGKFTHVYE